MMRAALKPAWGLAALALLAVSGCYDPDSFNPQTSLGSDGGDGDGDGSIEGEFSPPEPQLRSLLAFQYRASVRDLLGDEAEAVVEPPPDPTPLNGFSSIGASQLSLDGAAIDAYESSARAAAEVAAGDHTRIDEIAGCTPAGQTDATCLDAYVTEFGFRAFRRPLTAEETVRYVTVGDSATGDHYDQVRVITASMLQSPYFLYQVEVGEPDPNDPDRNKLTGYEVATRLSYFLLGTTPNPGLLRAAGEGALDSSDGVRDVATAMLARVEAREALDHFWSETFHLDGLTAESKDTTVFPTWNEELARDLRTETLLFLDDLVWEQAGDFREAWTSTHTFANQRVAELYDVPEAAAMGEVFTRVELPPETKRGGLLGQASYLAVLSNATGTSPTHRGKHVMEKILCTGIEAPPPDVMTEFEAGGDALTKAQLLQQHMEDPGCNSCHQFMDPIGLGLENYDGIGKFRTHENGVELETEWEAATLGTFDGAAELGTLVAADARSSQCLVLNLFRHASGHVETEGETDPLAAVENGFIEAEYRVQDMLIELVASPTFRYVGVPQ